MPMSWFLHMFMGHAGMALLPPKQVMLATVQYSNADPWRTRHQNVNRSWIVTLCRELKEIRQTTCLGKVRCQSRRVKKTWSHLSSSSNSFPHFFFFNDFWFILYIQPRDLSFLPKHHHQEFLLLQMNDLLEVGATACILGVNVNRGCWWCSHDYLLPSWSKPQISSHQSWCLLRGSLETEICFLPILESVTSFIYDMYASEQYNSSSYCIIGCGLAVVGHLGSFYNQPLVVPPVVVLFPSNFLLARYHEK